MRLLGKEAGQSLSRVEKMQRQQGEYRETEELISKRHKVVCGKPRRTVAPDRCLHVTQVARLLALTPEQLWTSCGNPPAMFSGEPVRLAPLSMIAFG